MGRPEYLIDTNVAIDYIGEVLPETLKILKRLKGWKSWTLTIFKTETVFVVFLIPSIDVCFLRCLTAISRAIVP